MLRVDHVPGPAPAARRQAVAEADACLVPALVLVGTEAADEPGARIREYRSPAFHHRDLPGVIDDLRDAAAWAAPAPPRRLTRSPFSPDDEAARRW